MNKKNRYCKGYTAWLAHAKKPKKGQVVIGYDKDTGAPIYGDNWTGGSGTTNKSRKSTSRDYGIGYLDEDTGTAWRGGSGTIGNVNMPQGDNDKIMKGIQTARSDTYEPDVRKTTGRQRSVSEKIGTSGGSGWKAYDTQTSYKMTPDGQLMKISSSKNNVTGDVSSSAKVIKKPSPSSKPSNWDTHSSEFKAWKKRYNAWYYQTHKDDPDKSYWNGLANRANASGSKISYAERDKVAAEARARANSDRANRVGTEGLTNAQRMLYRSARDTNPSRPTFGGELFNAKTRLNDLWSSGADAIASAGRNVINKAKANRSSFNDMWANGASAIASAGKSFLDAWKAGIGK